MYTLIDKLSRKKYLSFGTSPLPRVLTLLDLTTLGIGSTVGVGFYILAGQVARNTAGPAVTICFLIAALASMFSGLCYAEFGARVPKAGSAYIYSYVCVGEFVAFIIGWNLILEYVIGTASVAKGYSAYIDDLANHTISEALRKFLPLNSPGLASYADFFAFTVILVIMCIHMVGVKESTTVNNIFTAVNSLVISYVIIAGATQADVTNWKLSEEDITNGSVCSVPKNGQSSPWGSGGFSPYGFDGIMQGAATCFFGFVGFDVIATTGEEALKPERNIPLAIAISLSFVFLAYLGMSSVLTLALPYCMLDPDAPLIELFEMKGMMVSKWIVSIGAIFGFSASLVGAMFPMPRIIYAMADDGLLFRPLAIVSKRFKTPILSTLLSGLFAGIMALLFSLDALVDMMSIGTLMAYTIVALCVMLLRYQDRESRPLVSSEYHLLKYVPEGETDSTSLSKNSTPNRKTFDQHSGLEYVKQLINSKGLREPTELTTSLVNYTTLVFCLLCFLLALFLRLFASHLKNMNTGMIALVVVVFALTMLSLLFISLQPPATNKLPFKVPLVPWIPAISVFINLYLMCNLTAATWIRFGVWMFIGLSTYFGYGFFQSSVGLRFKGEMPPSVNSRKINMSSIKSIFESDSDDEFEVFSKSSI